MQPGLVAGGAMLISYLLGAVPFALLAGRLKGIDLRQHGSGNLGATNAIRVLGKPIGLTVFALDFLKGLGPVLLVRSLPQAWIAGLDRELIAFACGAAAVLGHVFSVYLGFRGGKGVASTAGVLLALRWDAALVSFIVFFLVRRLFGYVSVASMALAIAFPASLIALHWDLAINEYKWVTSGSALLALLIILRHKSNLVRIIRGEEPKLSRSTGKRGKG